MLRLLSRSVGLWAASAALALAIAGSAAAAPVMNGSFEDTSSSDPTDGLVNSNKLPDLAGGTGTGSWDVFTSIPNWTTTSGAGIEVQTNATLGSIDARPGGEHYVELDSHPSANSNSTMEQEIALAAGKYRLDFWYSPRDTDVGSNGIAYSVANLDSFVDVQSTSVGIWTLITGYFTTNGPSVTLSFKATGTQNTLGGFIDDISVVAVPIPPASLLLFGALGGLGYVARRRKPNLA